MLAERSAGFVGSSAAAVEVVELAGCSAAGSLCTEASAVLGIAAHAVQEIRSLEVAMACQSLATEEACLCIVVASDSLHIQSVALQRVMMAAGKAVAGHTAADLDDRCSRRPGMNSN